jgi:hypothetical protein
MNGIEADTEVTLLYALHANFQFAGLPTMMEIQIE